MTFDVFMELCLYDPDHGFFGAGDVRPGKHGDFVTSPEISPAFGMLLGRWAALVLPPVHDPDWAVVEIGAGSGTLLHQMGQVVDAATPLYAVERSPSARSAIAYSVPGTTVVPDIDHVSSRHVVAVLNEVLDNVPASIVRRHADGWTEFAVGLDGSELCLIQMPARPELMEWVNEHLVALDEGAIATVQRSAGGLIESILTRYDGVSMCVIDYGGSTEELAERTADSVVRTYRHQRTGFDYLLHPGETDITVDVNTDALMAIGRRHGAKVRCMSQAEFLTELGARDLIDGFRTEEHRLAAEGDVMGQLKARSDGLGVATLIDPKGFGDFRVVTIDREPRGTLPTS